MSLQLTPEERSIAAVFAGRFQLRSSQFTLLHRGEGTVIEVTSPTGASILKIEPLLTTRVEHSARTHWMRYLSSHGISIPELLVSPTGRYVEFLERPTGTYVCIAYRALPLDEHARIDWRHPGEARNVGRLIARMHLLAVGYLGKRPNVAVGHWHAARWVRAPRTVLHASQEPIIARIESLRQRLASLPRRRDTYGLVHDDLHTGNLFRVANRLTVIDFGCLHRAWYASDIASAFVFRLWISAERDDPRRTAAGVSYMKRLLAGYAGIRELPDGLFDMLPDLLSLRELSLYQSLYGHLDAAKRAETPLFDYLYDRLAAGQPFVHVDWSQVEESLTVPRNRRVDG